MNYLQIPEDSTCSAFDFQVPKHLDFDYQGEGCLECSNSCLIRVEHMSIDGIVVSKSVGI